MFCYFANGVSRKEMLSIIHNVSKYGMSREKAKKSSPSAKLCVCKERFVFFGEREQLIPMFLERFCIRNGKIVVWVI